MQVSIFKGGVSMQKNLYEVTISVKNDKNGNPMLKDTVWFVPAHSAEQAEQEMESVNGVEKILSVEYAGTLSEHW